MKKGRESKAAKKLLTAALAVMMAVAFMPAGSVFAASKSAKATPKRTAVQTVKQRSASSDNAASSVEAGTEDELTAAVKDAKDGQEIKLTKDITLTKGITIEQGKSVTIDLNQHTIDVNITADKTIENAFTVSENASLTLKNGTVSGRWLSDGKWGAYDRETDSAPNVRAIEGKSGSTITLNNTSIYNFYVKGHGGAVLLDGSTLNADKCNFGKWWKTSDGKSEYYGNHAYSGGSIYADNSSVDVENSKLEFSTATEPTDKSSDTPYYGGGAVYLQNSAQGKVVKLNNNLFWYDNTRDYGGAVYIAQMQAAVEITNNTFDHNHAYNHNGGVGGDGGAIYSRICQDVTITGNTMTNNVVMNNGGGLMAAVLSGQTLKLDKNIINSNQAARRGGGMKLMTMDGADLEIGSGEIRSNKAGIFGGGIDYTTPSSTVLKLTNALITGNQATWGAGVWTCPSSHTESYSTLGGAIYGNQVTEYKNLANDHYNRKAASGDDIRYEGEDTTDKYINNHQSYDQYTKVSSMTVSPRALGGGLMKWYDDEPNARYHSGQDEADPSLYTNTKKSFGLHGELDSEYQTLANKEARLIIKDNQVKGDGGYGGGIASNSTIQIGEKDADVTVKVTKKWPNSADAQAVKVDLYRVNADGSKVKLDHDVELSKDNNWTKSFTNLPSKYTDDNGKIQSCTYAVEEQNDGDWEAATTSKYSEQDKTYNITLSNTEHHYVIQGKKVWNDENNKDGKRPAAINVSLYANGHKVATHSVTAKNAEKDHSNIWDFKFSETKLAKYKDADGNLNFTVADDDNTTPYLQTQVGDKDNDYTLTNSYKPEEFCIPVWVSWDDNQNQDNVRPDSVTVHVKGTVPDKTDASKTTTVEDKTLTLTRNGGWYDTDTLHNLPVYSDGQKITYSLTVEKTDSVNSGLKDYTTTVTGCAEKGFQVTNVYEPKTTDVTVTKKWSDNDSKSRPDKITVDLKGNGTVLDEATLDAKDQTDAKDKNTWTYTFKNVPVSKGGKALTYNVSEEVPDGYSAKVVKNSDASFTITNTLKQSTSGGGGGTVIVQPANDHKVTFHPNNGDADTTQTVKDGAQVSKPYNPSNSGYTFEGWYTDSTFKNAYDFSTPVKGDLDLYAKWTKVIPESTPGTSKVKGILLPKVIANGSSEQTLTWTALTNVDGYYVYRAKCNIPKPLTIYKFKKVADVFTSSPRVFKSYGLKKGVAYKYYVVGYKNVNGQKMIVQKSVTVHSVAGNLLKKKYAKYTNVKKVSVTKNAVTLKVGKTYKIQPSVKGVLSGCEILQKDHAAMFRYVYIKDGKNIKVSQNGTVKALKAGKCNVYVLGTNGVRTKVAVTVVK